MTKSLDKRARRLATVTAELIAKAQEIGLRDTPDKLGISTQAIQLLARAHVELRAQVRSLHDLVDQTDPADPIGVALTKVGLTGLDGPRPRLVPTSDQVAAMSTNDLRALYLRVMGHVIDFTKHEAFVVRVWDGMDGCWTDCTEARACDEALRYWAEKTDGGAHHVRYSEIDYYAIFPAGTHMMWDGSEGREMRR